MTLGTFERPAEVYDRFIHTVRIQRPEARVTITFAAGPLGGLNEAKVQAHEAKVYHEETFGFGEIVAFGVDPKRLLAVDAEIEAIGKIIHDALVAKGKDPLA